MTEKMNDEEVQRLKQAVDEYLHLVDEKKELTKRLDLVDTELSACADAIKSAMSNQSGPVALNLDNGKLVVITPQSNRYLSPSVEVITLIV